MMKYNPNPVRFEDDKWWFWNETWTERYGPYETEEEAADACIKYCKEMLNNE